ncbi:MAG: type II toxin-antitoxin system VapB family antitoxin [Chloroflexi bacterium]|nr:type II toxin-antitoxin system VapB family antitoxin [Chloroflexota bacterium]
MTRRTVVIDDKLLDEARRVLGTRTIRATIEIGLREAIRKQRLEELRQSLGTLDLNLTAKDLERLRDEG